MRVDELQRKLEGMPADAMVLLRSEKQDRAVPRPTNNPAYITHLPLWSVFEKTVASTDPATGATTHRTVVILCDITVEDCGEGVGEEEF